MHAPRHRLAPRQQNIEVRPEALVSFRWSKQPQTIWRDRLSTRTNLATPFAATESQKQWVVLRMIRDRMTTVDHTAYDIGMLLSLSPNHEKRRSRPMSFQDIKQARRIFWMRPIIKGQRGNWVTR